ncbi:ParB/RepB/Spo0J family partition protein [Streptomyces sp. JV184]|uniref:ParB/RepB/Spo0J family partition protein n=1 Tax=Streptomyces sp. JV184 TaxID=858637 RepID=UPI002E7985BC|nr:ParB/RepB/Spo0J family partition protein [Streptomyces sp. JV184]MEE1743178.1 ParB/RepB/Spo0J family partition protein [Streptomyces sp. JV184]
MSKAGQLGTGRFGGAQGVSARRQAVAAATGAVTVGASDSRLSTIPLDQLVPTRFNPRRNFGSDSDLLDFGLKLKKKQLQPAVAVTREAYLRLWEGEGDSVGTARYVIANGERRYRASLAAGIGTLEVVVDDDVAKSRADFLDAVLSENNDREDLDPIERALGIQTMVEELGGKTKVAEHYGKSGGWVTQQMYLLNLAPELQALVSSGDLPVRETRTLVKLPHDEQLRAWQDRALEREEEKERPRVRRSTEQAPTPPAATGSFFTAVKNEPRPPEESVAAPLVGDRPRDGEAPTPPEGFQPAPLAAPPAPQPQAIQMPPVSPAPQGLGVAEAPLPEPRVQPHAASEALSPFVPRATDSSVPQRPPIKMPWHDGPAVAELVFRKMTPEQRQSMLLRLGELEKTALSDKQA